MSNILEVWNITGAIIAAFGGAGVIVIALSSWLGKVWASRLMEKEKAEHSKELEKLKSDFTQDTEKYKLQLKKSELFFEKQYHAATEFGKFYFTFMPKRENEFEEWEDAARQITSGFREYRRVLTEFEMSYNILFDEKFIPLVNDCQNIIQSYYDDKSKHDREEQDEKLWDDKRWVHGDRFYKKLTELYTYIKESVASQVKY